MREIVKNSNILSLVAGGKATYNDNGEVVHPPLE